MQLAANVAAQIQGIDESAAERRRILSFNAGTHATSSTLSPAAIREASMESAGISASEGGAKRGRWSMLHGGALIG